MHFGRPTQRAGTEEVFAAKLGERGLQTRVVGVGGESDLARIGPANDR